MEREVLKEENELNLSRDEGMSAGGEQTASCAAGDGAAGGEKTASGEAGDGAACGEVRVTRPLRARVMAWILLGVIFLLLAGFIICLITGSRYMYGMLFLLIFVPVFFYLMLWIKKVFSR